MGTAALDERGNASASATTLIPWTGPLDVETVPRYEERLSPYLRKPDQTILLDFRRVDYIDSAGLRFLLALKERVAEYHDRIVLIMPQESRVERTVRLVGFDQQFEIVRHPAEAWRPRLETQ
jgi:anti-anti-sigma factor